MCSFTCCLCVFVNSCIFSLATQTWQALEQRADRDNASLSIRLRFQRAESSFVWNHYYLHLLHLNSCDAGPQRGGSAKRGLINGIKANQSVSGSKRVGVWALPKWFRISHSVPATESLLQLGEQEGASGAVVWGRGEKYESTCQLAMMSRGRQSSGVRPGWCPEPPLLSSGVVPDVILNFIPKILLEMERKNGEIERIKQKQQ